MWRVRTTKGCQGSCLQDAFSWILLINGLPCFLACLSLTCLLCVLLVSHVSPLKSIQVHDDLSLHLYFRLIVPPQPTQTKTPQVSTIWTRLNNLCMACKSRDALIPSFSQPVILIFRASGHCVPIDSHCVRPRLRLGGALIPITATGATTPRAQTTKLGFATRHWLGFPRMIIALDSIPEQAYNAGPVLGIFQEEILKNAREGMILSSANKIISQDPEPLECPQEDLSGDFSGFGVRGTWVPIIAN